MKLLKFMYYCSLLYGTVAAIHFIISLSCLLSADSLPRDSDEFYHFCYVSASDRRVRGVSTPFQFASERQNDWEIVEPLLSGETMNGESAEHEAVQQQQQQMVWCTCSFLSKFNSFCFSLLDWGLQQPTYALVANAKQFTYCQQLPTVQAGGGAAAIAPS